MQILLVPAAAPLGQRLLRMCDGVSEYPCSPAPGSLLVGLFGLPGCQGAPSPTVVGVDPTDILGGESPPKVAVAGWGEGIWCRCDFGSHTQPNCCPSQML